MTRRTKCRLRGSLTRFGAPQAAVDFENDTTLLDAIAAAAHAVGLTTWDIHDAALDHGTVVPLWFLAEAGWDGRTVVLALNYPGSGLEPLFGQAVARAASR